MNAVTTTKPHKSGWNVKFLHCSDLGVSDKGRSSRVHYRPTVTCHHRNHRLSYRGACTSVEASMLETPAIIRPFIRCVWHKLHKNTPLLGDLLATRHTRHREALTGWCADCNCISFATHYPQTKNVMTWQNIRRIRIGKALLLPAFLFLI